MKKFLKKNTYVLINIVSVIAFFIIWQIYAQANKEHSYINPKFMPAPTDILTTFKKYLDAGTLFENIYVSVLRIAEGFALGTVIAVLLGYLMSKHPVFENIVNPLISFFGAIPPYAFMPLFIIWFGIGEDSKVILITFSAFLPMLSYTIQGIKSIDPLLIRSAKSLGANNLQVFRYVVLKSALPSIIAGMKVSVSLSFSALIVAEMIGADKGLGYIIVDARNYFKVADMFMAMVIIAVLSILIQTGFNFIEKKLFKWKKDGMSSAVEQ
ncbi:MAG: ABC transporter permease [Lachnospiraceae bacterium]|nr:ABC transporter permease [Lachnospiraceae bacterium]